MTLRWATDVDRHAVLALGVAEEAAWFGEPEHSAREVGEWIDGEGGVALGVVAFESEGVRGFASPGRLEAVFVADPAGMEGVADELLAWLGQQRDVVEVMTFAGDTRRLAAFERHGMRHRRSSFSLVRPASAGSVPAAAFPDGVNVAPYRLGDADEEVYRLIYVDAAWAWVSGHAERDQRAQPRPRARTAPTRVRGPSAGRRLRPRARGRGRERGRSRALPLRRTRSRA